MSKKVLSTYAAYSINQSERRASSSGGLFSLLAKWVLSNSGIVYGVAMSADCMRTEFVRVTDESKLCYLRGSKYQQAHVDQTFKSVNVIYLIAYKKKMEFKNSIALVNKMTRGKLKGLFCKLGMTEG